MAFTFFFRDNHTLEQVIKHLLPRVEGVQKIKIWDAGCAMGPEPYTFLILLSEIISYWSFKKIFMDATDIDESDVFGTIIKDGIYSYNELKRIPKEIFQKYFKKTNNDSQFQINEEVRSKINFHKHDLTSLKPLATGYNLIICKNVLLHLEYKMRVEVYKMFHSVLDSNGIFVSGVSNDISLLDVCVILIDRSSNMR